MVASPALRYRTAVALLTAGAFAVRTLTLTGQSLWLDEVDAIAFAGRSIPDLWAMIGSPAQNGALFYVLLKGWLSLTGILEFTLRYFSVLPSVLVIPLVYALGRRLLSPEAGFWGALLAATSPYLFFYAQEGKMYALYACLTVLGMYLFLAALEEGGRWRWAGYAIVTVVGVYVHLFFVFLVVAQHLLAALALLRGRPRGLRGWYLTQGLMALPLLPLALWGIPAVLEGYPTAFAPHSPGRILQVLFLRFTLHTEAWPSPFVLFPFAVAFGAAFLLLEPAATGQGRGGRPLSLPWLPRGSRAPSCQGEEGARSGQARGRAGLLFVLLWLTVPVAASYLVSLQVPAFMHRYFTLVVPAYYLALGAGLAALWRRWPLLGLACAAAILGVWGTVLLHPAEVRPDFRHAARFLMARAEPGDAMLFVAEYGARAFAFYAPDHPPALAAPYSNDGSPPEAIAAALEERTAPYRRVWLVLYEEWVWDGRQILSSWLDGHGLLVEATAFPGVTVRAYDLSH